MTILQTVRNGCVRFGGLVEIQVSYKILHLELGSTKDGPNFVQSTLISGGAILRQPWTQNGHKCLRIK